MTNKNNTVLYTGVTNDLKRRVYVHKEKKVEGFTKKYNVTKLVYYELFRDVKNAIFREKQIKGGSRAKKLELIARMRDGRICMIVCEIASDKTPAMTKE